MNCVSWNCWQVQELSDILKEKGPNLVCLMENKTKASYLEKLRCKPKFDNQFMVPRKNRGGGLALLWMNDLKLHIRTFSPRHIDVVINPGIDDAWRFTGFYGVPKVANWEDSS